MSNESPRDWRCVEQWTAMEVPSRRRGDDPLLCRLANGMGWQWAIPMEAAFVKKSDYFDLVGEREALVSQRDRLKFALEEMLGVFDMPHVHTLCEVVNARAALASLEAKS